MCWIMSCPDGWKGILAGITGYFANSVFFLLPVSGFNSSCLAPDGCAPLRHRRLIMKRRATPSLVPLTNESRQRWSGSPLPPHALPRWKKEKKKGLANARPILPSHSLLSWMVSWEMWAPRGVHSENQRPRRPLVCNENFEFGVQFLFPSLAQDHGLFTQGQPSERLWVKDGNALLVMSMNSSLLSVRSFIISFCVQWK